MLKKIVQKKKKKNQNIEDISLKEIEEIIAENRKVKDALEEERVTAKSTCNVESHIHALENRCFFLEEKNNLLEQKIVSLEQTTEDVLEEKRNGIGNSRGSVCSIMLSKDMAFLNKDAAMDEEEGLKQRRISSKSRE